MLSSQEVATLITALGTGIGAQEFSADKLRYHRIIIMTDADVDGSHIRTLLLTFFYRQMPELLERGHIYIAQPPLYKLKRGKKERYIKDDNELEEYLLTEALDGASFEPAKGAPVSGAELAGLARNYLNVRSTIGRLSRRYDQKLLFALMQVTPLDAGMMADESKVAAVVGELQALFPVSGNGGARYEFSYGMDPRSEAHEIVLDRIEHGSVTHARIDNLFVASGEYQNMRELGQKLQQLFAGGVATIKRADREQAVSDFGVALDWLMNEARRGQTIQRYKGLGEMNPDQLWETTMDPAVRRLLRVDIEDIVASDEVFTTLMGDQVEPRREFIEKNALMVSNLDI